MSISTAVASYLYRPGRTTVSRCSAFPELDRDLDVDAETSIERSASGQIRRANQSATRLGELKQSKPWFLHTVVPHAMVGVQRCSGIVPPRTQIVQRHERIAQRNPTTMQRVETIVLLRNVYRLLRRADRDGRGDEANER